MSKIGAVAETDSSGAAAFPVTVEVTGKRKDLYAGTSAELSIIVQQRTDVLTVATRALESEDGATYVNVVRDGETQRTEVEVGETYGATTEIVSGLAAGDVVEIPGFTMPTGSGGADGSGQQEMPGGGEFPQMPEGGFPEGGFPGAEQ